MTDGKPSSASGRAARREAGAQCATLTFERAIAAPPSIVWRVWTDPTARAIWASPSPAVVVEFLEADTRVGGREISLCKAEGQPDIRAECGWLALQAPARSINYEVVSCEGVTQSAALATAEISGGEEGSRLVVTVQLSSLARDMAAGYRQGFNAALENLDGVARRTMMLERIIRAPLPAVWKAWTTPQSLQQWWGPDGFSCRTKTIDVRTGGEWIFDMIGPDGAVFPNHHLYREVRPQARIAYALLWGENGPKHADAWATLEDCGGATKVTLCMAFVSEAEFEDAKGFGAVELGHQTLGKLERFVAAR